MDCRHRRMSIPGTGTNRPGSRLPRRTRPTHIGHQRRDPCSVRASILAPVPNTSNHPCRDCCRSGTIPRCIHIRAAGPTRHRMHRPPRRPRRRPFPSHPGHPEVPAPLHQRAGPPGRQRFRHCPSACHPGRRVPDRRGFRPPDRPVLYRYALPNHSQLQLPGPAPRCPATLQVCPLQSSCPVKADRERRRRPSVQPPSEQQWFHTSSAFLQDRPKLPTDHGGHAWATGTHGSDSGPILHVCREVQGNRGHQRSAAESPAGVAGIDF